MAKTQLKKLTKPKTTKKSPTTDVVDIKTLPNNPSPLTVATVTPPNNNYAENDAKVATWRKDILTAIGENEATVAPKPTTTTPILTTKQPLPLPRTPITTFSKPYSPSSPALTPVTKLATTEFNKPEIKTVNKPPVLPTPQLITTTTPPILPIVKTRKIAKIAKKITKVAVKKTTPQKTTKAKKILTTRKRPIEEPLKPTLPPLTTNSIKPISAGSIFKSPASAFVKLPAFPSTFNIPSIKQPVKSFNWTTTKTTLSLLTATIFIVLYGAFYLLRFDQYYPAISQKLFWPAAYINGYTIWSNNLTKQIKALTPLYKIANNNLTTANIEQLAYQRMVEDLVISQALANERLTIPPGFKAQELIKINETAESFMGFNDDLKNTCGCTKEFYQEYLVEPYLRRQLLFKHLSQKTDVVQTAQTTATAIFKKITSGQISFVAAAQKWNEDSTTNKINGSLGWFTLGTLPTNLETALKKLRPGEISAPIQTDKGIYIMRLDAIDKTKKNNNQLQASQIFINYFNFDNWLAQAINQTTTIKLLPLLK